MIPKFKPKTELILNRLVKYLSCFESARNIQTRYGISREFVRDYFAKPHIKLSHKTVTSIVKKIARKPYTYVEVLKKFGSRGLHALSAAHMSKKFIDTRDLYRRMAAYKKAHPLVSLRQMHKIFNVSVALFTVAWQTFNDKRMEKSSSVRGRMHTDTIERLYKSGVTNTCELARSTGLKRNTVVACLNERGIYTMKKLPDEELVKIHYLRTAAKLPWKTIAQIYNTTTSAISGTYMSRKHMVKEIQNAQEKESIL